MWTDLGVSDSTKNMEAKSEDKAAHQIHKNYYLGQKSNAADWD